MYITADFNVVVVFKVVILDPNRKSALPIFIYLIYISFFLHHSWGWGQLPSWQKFIAQPTLFISPGPPAQVLAVSYSRLGISSCVNIKSSL